MSPWKSQDKTLYKTALRSSSSDDPKVFPLNPLNPLGHCLSIHRGMKNLFQPFFSHLTPFPCLHIRGRCTHALYKHLQRPSHRDTVFTTLSCHQDATHLSKAHCTSLARTITFCHHLPARRPRAQWIMVAPGFIQLTGTSSGFVLPNTTASACPSWGKPKTPPGTKQAFNLRNTYLGAHLKNIHFLYSSSLLGKAFTDDRNEKGRSELIV